MAAKECPLCAEMMQLRERETTDRVPGMTQTKTTKYREWVCPECEYFEEAEAGDFLGG
jgi:acetone carboxylase gamma subunit